MKRSVSLAFMVCAMFSKHVSMADPITNLDADILSKLPSNSYQDYVDLGTKNGGGAYIWSGSNGSYIPVYGDNSFFDDTSGTGWPWGFGLHVNGTASGLSVGVIVGDGATVKTTKDDADGIRTDGDANNTNANPNFVIVGNNLSIKTEGYSADGINAGYRGNGLTSATGSSIIFVGDNAHIETYGEEARGISAYKIWAGKANTNEVTLGKGAYIATYGDQSEGIRAGGQGAKVTLGDYAHIKTDGLNSQGLYADSSSQIILGEESVIETTQEGSHAVYATSSALIGLGKDVSISVSDQNNTHAIYVGTSSNVVLEGGGNIFAAGNKATGSYAITTVNGNVTAKAGVYTITGDLSANRSGTAVNTGIIDLTMSSGSSWIGASYLVGNGEIDINMQGSLWNMTDSSHVSSLIDQGSRINFKSSVAQPFTLTLGSLKGNNTVFGMNVNLGNITTAQNMHGERVGNMAIDGDLLNIANLDTGSGSYLLDIKNQGGANTTGDEVLQVVKIDNGGTGNFSLSHNVEAGSYEYGLRQATSGVAGWELYRVGYSTTSEASVSFLNNNYLLNYVDTQTLLQRLGELRTTKNEGNFWIRSFAGKLSSFSGQQLSGFDMNYRGVQLGIDKRFGMKNGQLYTGLMVGITDADPNYRGGQGTTKDYHLGLYSTYLFDNGIYIDGILKYTHMRNRFKVKDTAGDSVSGQGSSNGYSASIEGGKRFYFAKNKDQGYYLEPQAQLTYGHQGSMTVNADNGLKTVLNDYNYTLGRVSLIAGYQMIQGDNPIEIYMKTGYVREMSADVKYKRGQQTHRYDFRSGWWDNGVGVNAQLNKRHNIYAELDYATGSRFNKKQVNIGYRYNF